MRMGRHMLVWHPSLEELGSVGHIYNKGTFHAVALSGHMDCVVSAVELDAVLGSFENRIAFRNMERTAGPSTLMRSVKEPIVYSFNDIRHWSLLLNDDIPPLEL